MDSVHSSLPEAGEIISSSADSNPLSLADSDRVLPAPTNLRHPCIGAETVSLPQPAPGDDKADDSTSSDGALPARLDEIFAPVGLVVVPTTRASEIAMSAVALCAMGIQYGKQYDMSGKLQDINMAIKLLYQVVLLAPGVPEILCNLGGAHRRRYVHMGDLGDINKAIAYQSKAATLAPSHGEEKPNILNELAFSHYYRFERIDNLEDIDMAIACLSQAIRLTGHADQAGWLNLTNLGLWHSTRFERLSDLEDLEKAIEYTSQAVRLIPNGHAARAGLLSSFGLAHRTRFERLGNLEDLEKAIACQSQAVQLAPNGHADNGGWLTNLGASHQSRFERLGNLEDINKAIAYHLEAVSLTPNGHASMCKVLNNLGNSHRGRFKHLGDLADIDKAIEFQTQAGSLTPNGHKEKPYVLTNLANSYLNRHAHLGQRADLDMAIKYHAQAAFLIPNGHAQQPGTFSNLGNSHRIRFGHRGEIDDINKAIECFIQADLLTPDDHAQKYVILGNLGISHEQRFVKLHDITDIERSIACHSQAVSLLQDDHVQKPVFLGNLGNSYRSRFKHLGEISDIDKAIECHSRAAALTPEGHVNKVETLVHLANSHRSRSQYPSHISEQDQWLSFAQMAASCTTGKSSTRFKASRIWAKQSVQCNPAMSLSAYQRTMEIIPQVVWIGSTINRRYDHIRLIGDFAMEATAFAISVQEYGLALEWLEAGRSIVWNQMLELRTQFDDLSTADPKLASRLREVSMALEHAGSQDTEFFLPVDEESARKHRRLAEDYEGLLNQARHIPGFQSFMRPREAAALMPAARSGPVVVINIHASRCDALIIRPGTDDIIHVPLPNVSDTKVTDLQTNMAGYTSRGMTERRPRITPRKPKDSLDSILSSLWHNIVQPVLTSLGYTEKLPADQLPHITWCTTGALSMLPIHAAGCYNQEGENLFAYAISSYAPNLGSLLSSKSRSLGLGAILAVSQEATLPATRQELAHIKRHAGELPYLQLENHEATAETVLDAMEQFNSVHFACHASQNLNRPLNSGFHLHDQGLSLANITKRSLSNKGLAFLSACQTATGDTKSPDEAIHLAAGMLVAGYPTVIATMWSIMDSDAPIVADSVYGQLAKEGRIDDGKVARALHVAVADLRDRVGETEFVRWVPYIHIGI